MTRFRKHLIALSLAALLLIVPAKATAGTVTPGSPGDWTTTTTNTATGDFTDQGFRMRTGSGVGPGNGGKVYIGTVSINGPVANLTGLSYSTKIDPGSAAAAHLTIAINLYLDCNTDGSYDDILVYEPVYSHPGPRPTGVWETWNPLSDSWWSVYHFVGYTSFSANLAACATPEILWLSFLAGTSGGTPWVGFDGWIDNVVINGTTYQFRPDGAGGSGVEPPLFSYADGRINRFERVACAALYPVNVGGERGLHAYFAPQGPGETPYWELRLNVSPAEIAAVPEQPAANTLIATNDDSSLAFYRLVSGEFQVNCRYPDGRPEEVIIFEDLTPTSFYYVYVLDGRPLIRPER